MNEKEIPAAHAAMDETMEVVARVSAEVSDQLEGKSPAEIGTIIHEKIESIFSAQMVCDDEPDLLNSVTDGLLQGQGASEDHATFEAALKKAGFDDKIIERITWAVCTTEPRDVHIAALKTLEGMGYEYRGGELWAPSVKKAARIGNTLFYRRDWPYIDPRKTNTDETLMDTTPAMTAPDLLDAAAGHMRDRAKTYDKPGGERSMGKTVEMFNIATGRDMAARDRIQLALIAIKTNLVHRGNEPELLEMVDGVGVLLRDIKPMLRESEGWLLLELLKIVRGETRADAHRDSLEDGIAYSALKAEARLAGR